MRRALAAASGPAFRVIHWSVQTDHVHLLVEADERAELIRGMPGLAVRYARAVNRAAGRRGSVWGERYHAHARGTPTEVRRGIVYVLLNHRKHLKAAPSIDPRSSGAWFDGWRTAPPPRTDAAPVARPTTWLAREGWRRAGGAIVWTEAPSRKESKKSGPTRMRRSAASRAESASREHPGENGRLFAPHLIGRRSRLL